MDINIQGIFLYVCGAPPARLDQLFASSDQPRAPDQSFEQFKLLSRQRDLLTETNSDAAVSIQRDTSGACRRQLDLLQRVSRWRRPAPAESPE